MMKLIIENIEKNNYLLRDKDNNIYKFHRLFYDIEKKPKVGDSLFLHDKLIKSPNHSFNFGPLNSKYGKNILSIEDPDFIILLIDQENLYLKRLYG